MPLAILYAVYAWLAFICCVLVAIIGALLLPGLERRRRWVTASARASLLLCAIPARIDGMERLPQGHCIVVANHAATWME
jgi:1-acyl-sn-glycerol-3-phosphate acyltransferase